MTVAATESLRCRHLAKILMNNESLPGVAYFGYDTGDGLVPSSGKSSEELRVTFGPGLTIPLTAFNWLRDHFQPEDVKMKANILGRITVTLVKPKWPWNV